MLLGPKPAALLWGISIRHLTLPLLALLDGSRRPLVAVGKRENVVIIGIEISSPGQLMEAQYTLVLMAVEVGLEGVRIRLRDTEKRTRSDDLRHTAGISGSYGIYPGSEVCSNAAFHEEGLLMSRIRVICL